MSRQNDNDNILSFTGWHSYANWAMVRVRSQSPFTHTTHARSVRDALAIHTAGINVALIEREYSPVVRAEFERLNQRLSGEFRGTLTRTNTMSSLAGFLAPFCESRMAAQIILNELAAVIHDFMDLSRQLSVQIMFGQITSDHCHLFHDDKNQLRLVCSYTGKGTEWLKNEDVNRGGLGTGTNAGHIEGRPIQRLRPYDIAIMKGDLYTGNEGNGLVHRSPPLLDNDAARIFLALDATVRPADFLWKVTHPGSPQLFCRQVMSGRRFG